MHQQAEFEIVEILDSLRGRTIIASGKLTDDGAVNCLASIDRIAGRKQGGFNLAPVSAITLLDDDHRSVEVKTPCELWIVQWKNSGASMLLIEK